MSALVNQSGSFKHLTANGAHESTRYFLVHCFDSGGAAKYLVPNRAPHGDFPSAYIMMATHLLSRYEREYIVSGVNEDFRADGRTCRDFRHFSLESGVVSNTSGSAKIQLVSSATQLSPAAQARNLVFYLMQE